ncbi:MAG: CRISPR-associated endonuclease Cas2 [Chloroflexi bacterium]|nr:CRISPR-associated endonuclease Cas2 [Chloroflexota bacterium]
MMVLITYDVNTESPAGRKRLQKVAKQCENYGQRVQNSVFECILEPAMLKQLQHRLAEIIDPKADSIRYYYLGDQWQNRVEHIGAKPSINLEGPLIV